MFPQSPDAGRGSRVLWKAFETALTRRRSSSRSAAVRPLVSSTLFLKIQRNYSKSIQSVGGRSRTLWTRSACASRRGVVSTDAAFSSFFLSFFFFSFLLPFLLLFPFFRTSCDLAGLFPPRERERERERERDRAQISLEATRSYWQSARSLYARRPASFC